MLNSDNFFAGKFKNICQKFDSQRTHHHNPARIFTNFFQNFFLMKCWFFKHSVEGSDNWHLKFTKQRKDQ